jgi:hypothetical protein
VEVKEYYNDIFNPLAHPHQDAPDGEQKTTTNHFSGTDFKELSLR